VPRLTETIAGEPIKGSWWGHPKSHRIFAILEVVTASEDVSCLPSVNGKITLVHRKAVAGVGSSCRAFSA